MRRLLFFYAAIIGVLLAYALVLQHRREERMGWYLNCVKKAKVVEDVLHQHVLIVGKRKIEKMEVAYSSDHNRLIEAKSTALLRDVDSLHSITQRELSRKSVQDNTTFQDIFTNENDLAAYLNRQKVFFDSLSFQKQRYKDIDTLFPSEALKHTEQILRRGHDEQKALLLVLQQLQNTIAGAKMMQYLSYQMDDEGLSRCDTKIPILVFEKTCQDVAEGKVFLACYSSTAKHIIVDINGQKKPMKNGLAFDKRIFKMPGTQKIEIKISLLFSTVFF